MWTHHPAHPAHPARLISNPPAGSCSVAQGAVLCLSGDAQYFHCVYDSSDAVTLFQSCHVLAAVWRPLAFVLQRCAVR